MLFVILFLAAITFATFLFIDYVLEVVYKKTDCALLINPTIRMFYAGIGVGILIFLICRIL